MSVSAYRDEIREEHAWRVLQDSLDNRAPFGVPTLLLRAEDVPPWDGIGHYIEGQLDRFVALSAIRQKNRVFDDGVSSMDFLAEGLIKALKNPWHANASCTGLGVYDARANEPEASIVIAPRENLTLNNLVRQMTDYAGGVADFPDFRFEVPFLMLWHEYGHAAGAGEPQADLISAHMYKKAFADNALLSVTADIRGINAVKNFNRWKIRDQYGWPMVTALDSVIDAPQRDIDAMTMDDVRELRDARFNPHKEELIFVGRTIRSMAQAAWRFNDLAAIGQAAEKALSKGGFRESPAIYGIASRFALAARRLTTGIEAYRPSVPQYTPEFHYA